MDNGQTSYDTRILTQHQCSSQPKSLTSNSSMTCGVLLYFLQTQNKSKKANTLSKPPNSGLICRFPKSTVDVHSGFLLRTLGVEASGR